MERSGRRELVSHEEEAVAWARLLRRAFGPDAAAEARRLAYERKAFGDPDGAAKWTKVERLVASGASPVKY